MNTNTILLVFAIVAAFGVVMATATALLPILQQAQAQGPACRPPDAGSGQKPTFIPCKGLGRPD
jgi:hypothetical protein